MLLWSLVALADDARGLVATEGWDRLDEIGRLSFTFAVEKGGAEVARRSWTWEPATGRATRSQGGASLSFVFGKPTNEAETKADAELVNDLFWLAPPLQLRWAEPPALVVTDGGAVEGPNGAVRSVTMAYAGEAGGYTPGDAYDLFLDPNGRLVAWTYRKGGGEPTLTTTFERYVEAGPLQVATDHRAADGSLRVQTTDVRVESPER